MVTVADIIALPAFENVELAAPCEGAERREVRNVGILDCPPDYNEYSVYKSGELILTNLGFAFGNPGMAEKSLLAMLRRDVAAIAIKTVYEPPISDAVRAESTARGVPCTCTTGRTTRRWRTSRSTSSGATARSWTRARRSTSCSPRTTATACARS
ncbi:PucR family transcriptional regulator ligand-binding domain-containing protein [Eggerthella sinensis]|uniref:PucR family transcriptional regulator ligand-binding domain-containing protein n=1 Tax=Eggerthella sinensis TaxID=242230 RepID=UPI0022E60917|nr:PucR family transcriptional regulator ligand-binding domain-containing protein [Eggerthella sinensis]